MSVSQVDHCVLTSFNSSNAWLTRSCSNSGEGESRSSETLPKGKAPTASNSVSASQSAILLRNDNSILIRSMPSVYSAMRGKGMTTSSLILNALVWRLMAAVRLRSSQNFFRASALTATKPSPVLRLAKRTTSEVARATASASSPAMSPNNTILGKPPRLDLVV